jgi:hypothetical protein
MPWPQNTNTPTQFLKNRWASQSFTQFQTIPLTSLVHRTHEYFKNYTTVDPKTVGGFQKCFGEQGQTHEIAAPGMTMEKIGK